MYADFDCYRKNFTLIPRESFGSNEKEDEKEANRWLGELCLCYRSVVRKHTMNPKVVVEERITYAYVRIQTTYILYIKSYHNCLKSIKNENTRLCNRL